MLVAIARPAAVVTLPSQQRDDHPGDGRVGQHARHRRPAQPPGRRAGRGQGVRRRAAAATCAIGIVVVRRHRGGRAAADAEPRGPARRDRPLPAAARHRDRQRHPGLAGDDLPRRRLRPAAARRPRGAERAARLRASTPARSEPKEAFKPVPPGLLHVGGDHPADRRPDAPPAPTRSRRPSMAADRGVRVYTVGIGTVERRDHRLRGLVDARAPRRGNAEGDRQHHARRILLRRHRHRPEEGLRDAELASWCWRSKETEITALFAAAAAVLAVLSALLSLLWFNRLL